MSENSPKKPKKIVVERTQTGVRMEKRLLKVLKALAEALDITLGDLLEGIVLHVFEGKTPFSPGTLQRIDQLRQVYGLDLGAAASHHLIEGQQESAFDALHVDRRGIVRVAAPPEEAMALFTPEGEKLWVPDWLPTYLHPADGEFARGLVWTTTHGGETTLWTVARFEEAGREVEYLRVTPGSRMGGVEVRCDGFEDGVTRVEVRYVLTGLSPAGNIELEELDAGYDAMLEEWEELIAAHLGRAA